MSPEGTQLTISLILEYESSTAGYTLYYARNIWRRIFAALYQRIRHLLAYSSLPSPMEVE